MTEVVFVILSEPIFADGILHSNRGLTDGHDVSDAATNSEHQYTGVSLNGGTQQP